jgi:hypothetical protein
MLGNALLDHIPAAVCVTLDFTSERQNNHQLNATNTLSAFKTLVISY